MKYFPKRVDSKYYNQTLSLSTLANTLETDKGTANARELSWGEKYPAHDCWHYTEVYEKYMSPFKEKPVKLLEIGICDVRFPFASVKMWLTYFKNIDLYCEDNFWGKEFSHEMIDHLLTNGANFIYADQSNVHDWLEIKTVLKDLDFVVEDGSHYPQHMMFSLYQAHDILKSGGMYFMEDIQSVDIAGHYGYDNSKLPDEIRNWQKSGELHSAYLNDSQNEIVSRSFKVIDLILDPSGKNYLGVFERI